MSNSFHAFKGGERGFVKRVFPRYPFTFLVFKADKRLFEVRDISFWGMRIALKDGTHGLSVGDCLVGYLHWKGESLPVNFQVKWSDSENAGGEFERNEQFDKKIRSFFCVENILKNLRPLHLQEGVRDLPANLKYWFKSDGTVEFFIWCDPNGKISSFQGVVLDKFFEWEEGQGMWTGRVHKHKDLDTPLDCWEEFVCEEDTRINSFVVDLTHKIFSAFPSEYLSDQDREFLLLKL